MSDNKSPLIPSNNSIDINKEMINSYMEYAMSVIVSRAIPDVRDGLKPVHRRILYSMHQMGCDYNRQYRKSARIVGEVMGKYHPHGDGAIYDALVRLAQEFSMGAMLIDGQGNFGSIDGDSAASMRYTEVRLKEISHYLLEEISQNTVDFQPNYDGSESEPIVLPARFPSILINGGSGIAVGMATNIPPHNLGEILNATLACIENPDITFEELFEIVPGPDFPTNGIIVGKSNSMTALATGRGSVIIRGRTQIEDARSGKEAIIISELPYQVNKVKLIENIVELIKDKRIEGITDIRDESSKDGIRVVIELRRDAQSEVILNQLYKYTQLQSSFGYNVLVLNNGRPEVMGLKGILMTFIDFRYDVIVRRTKHILNGYRDRAHVLIGLCVAVDSIDEVIKIIRGSVDVAEAREALINRQWPCGDSVEKLIVLVCDSSNKVIDGKFSFTQTQVKAILDMRLSKLTGLEKEKLVAELNELGLGISECIDILSNRSRIMEIMKNEIIEIRDKFSIPRRSEIIADEGSEIDMESLIPKEDIVISMTTNGFIARSSVDDYKKQKRGGKGKKGGMEARIDDAIADMLIATSHDDLLFFSNIGQVYKLKAYKLPIGGTGKKGRALINLLPLQEGESVANIIAIPHKEEDLDNQNLVFVTKNGSIRRSSMVDFINVNANGKIAIRLSDDDVLIAVKLVENGKHIMLSSKFGMMIRFAIDDLRIIKSRTSDGVRGMNLENGNEVVSVSILEGNEYPIAERDQYLSISYKERMKLLDLTDDKIEKLISKIQNAEGQAKISLSVDVIKEMAAKEQFLVNVTERGYGKRSSTYEYRITNRGGKGVNGINTSKRNGNVVATFVVEEANDLMLITKNGKTIRCGVSDISVLGRATQGVRIFNIDEKDSIQSVVRIECDDDEGSADSQMVLDV